MIWSIVGAVLGAGLQGSANQEQNQRASDAQMRSNEEYLRRISLIDNSYKKQIGQLQEQAASLQQDIQLEQTKTRYDSLKNEAISSNIIAERNIAGNTATRLYNQSSISELSALNVLKKRAEDTAASFGIEMENAKDRANSAIFGKMSADIYSQMSPMQNMSSTLSSGMSGYQMGASFDG